MEQSRLPLWEKTDKYRDSSRAWLHVPGHGGGSGLPSAMEPFAAMAAYDLTELPELDDLHSPGGAIALAQNLAAAVWGADNSYFLVNGSTAGVLAMILSCCQTGDTVLAPRNAHGSFYHALILSGAVPVYLPVPEKDGVALNITADTLRRAFERNPGARALFLTSPSYHGVCANLAEIAAVVRSSGAVLLLDEAHGAHLSFCRDLPQSDGHLADLRVQSWHKTLGALTPGAVLHRHGDRIPAERVQEVLRWVQSSSPSYPVLLSLDAVRRQMALWGSELAQEMAAKAVELRREIGAYLPLLTDKDLLDSGLRLDGTRITMLTGRSGICGLWAARTFSDCGIDTEFALPAAVLAVVGPGYRPQDGTRLAKALSAIVSDASPSIVAMPPLPEPEVVLTPRQGYYSASRRIPLQEALGSVAAETVCSYPPGIPLLVPGERVTGEVIDYLQAALSAGVRFRGIGEYGCLSVCLSVTQR